MSSKAHEHSRGDRCDVFLSTAIVVHFERVAGRLGREESQSGCHSVDDALHTDLLMPCTGHDRHTVVVPAEAPHLL